MEKRKGKVKNTSHGAHSHKIISAAHQGSPELLPSPNESLDLFYDAVNEPINSVVTSENESISRKVKKLPTPCESDFNLESIPTVSHFKERTWKGSQSRGVPLRTTEDKTMGTKRPFDKDGYVDGKWQKNQMVELNSCQFTHPASNKTVYIRKQWPGYLFTFDEEDFLARVNFNKLEELDFAGISVKTKRDFLNKLIITEVIKDQLISNRNTAFEQLKQHLQVSISKSADVLDCAEDLFQLSILLEDRGTSSDNISILDNLIKNESISSETKGYCHHLLKQEKTLDIRKNYLPQTIKFNTIYLREDLRQICENGIKIHRDTISSIAPPDIADHLDSLSGSMILYISRKDVELFADLEGIISEQSFLGLISNSFDSLLNKLGEIRSLTLSSRSKRDVSLKNYAPLTHPIYFYLCKSFLELVEEISIRADLSANDLLKTDQREFALKNSISWPSQSLLNNALESQYRFIFKLMMHYKPCYSNKSKFDYQMRLLFESDNSGSLWQRTKNFVKKKIKSFFSQDKLCTAPEERLVWIYLIDDAIADMQQLHEEELKLFEHLLKGCTDFIFDSTDDQHESFRVVTHNVIRFVAQTGPYLSNLSLGVDQDILKTQIESINRVISGHQFNNFRDLIDVYNEYWKYRESIVNQIPNKFPHGKFKLDMERMSQELLDIVNDVLSKDVEPHILIKYFRSFNEFLDNLNAIELSWFIKEISDLTGVKLVNKEKKSYQVLEPETFIKRHSNIPRHYLIETLQDLLIILRNILKKKEWSKDDNLNAASELLTAIKKSFLYLKEQPNYVSFETFKDESTKPFACAVENSTSYEDFKKRIEIVGESFWYLRKQDEIDIEKALELYVNENVHISAETVRILKNLYNHYLEKFNSYIQNNLNKSYDEKIKSVTEEVKTKLDCINIKNWEEKFKKETLPEILAGLAAVWSIQTSVDVGCTGKSLKPHCIQILCILRLLSVDSGSKGVDKHLAQVLTGQGKSLVLGLLSSLLALMGHEVRTVCYSEYLASRDQQDFKSFFKKFDIYDKITYGTFEDMANDSIRPKINGITQGLRELVEDRILNHSTNKIGKIMRKDIGNTILLIDEVDVFFSAEFYGNTYNPCNKLSIPALGSIQEKIWELANKSYGKSVILKEVEEFIKQKVGERNQDFKKFNQFYFKPGKYYLLNDKDNGFVKKEYDNKSLYEEHFDLMIDTAINVANASDETWFINKYKINEDGVITFKKNNGIYSLSTFINYYNAFNYFRLKKTDFNHNGFRNYGYMIISCGSISYAKLPEKYPLILGVSGTLTTLHDHEKKAIKEYYNINKMSVMPSYFGCSNLTFSIYSNFATLESEEEWLSKIFSHVNSEISQARSVLIFFDTDIYIEKFKVKYIGKFDRLHILTENTEGQSRNKYIDEAGITKTLTLATRGMGRGVDFKSSVAVEKNGGVHVIQTFFSIDIKEETQIKGRTARKDNKGSYELILCKKHLRSDGFINDNNEPVNYSSLNIARERKIKEIGSNVEDNITTSQSSHNITMEYFESFFKDK